MFGDERASAKEIRVARSRMALIANFVTRISPKFTKHNVLNKVT